MRKVILRFTVIFITLGLVAVTAIVWNFSNKVTGQNRVLLFTLKDSPKAATKDAKSSLASVRESEISFNFDNFVNQDFENLNIPLFDGKTYQALQSKSEGFKKRSEQSFTWRGKLVEGKFRGDVVLTFNKGFMAGLIYSPKAVYEIVAKGDKHILVELDQSLFPECGGEIEPPKVSENLTPQRVGQVSDSGDRIDVLVVYTEAVKNTLGGDSQAETLIQNAVDATNTAYINSKIRQRLRLVHTEQTALTEANSLSNLRADVTTQALRNTHNADVVAMIVDSLGGCGIGYLMRTVSNGFEGSAYSITRRSCAVGNLTFAHELGHNMGSTHNPKNASNAPAYPFSFGHYIDGNYRTVMSYSAQCNSGCSRVPQFSNPSIIFRDVPTGILGERNNKLSIENTADVVSNFRYSGSAIELTNYSENAFIPRNISKTLNWSSDNLGGNVKIEISRDEGTSWETLIANTPNDGSEIISVNGRPTKRVRVRITSLNDSNISDTSVKNLSIK